ncbi:hypothetical protein PT85_01975 [Pseudomonas flexibilis]|nr:hypothetical protein PT85_01975 [Pseudomonas flexibilis]
MCRLLQWVFCICLGCAGAPAASANSQEHELCRSAAFRTLNSLCEAVMRIFPVRDSQQTVATVPEPVEPDVAKPLDLTLPPLLGQDDNGPLESYKPLLPPLFGLKSQPGGMTLGGRLITSEPEAEFEFDLSNMLERIEGAEISIQIRR